MPESLYFLGVVPPVEIAEQVEEFRQIMAKRYRSRHALKSPPHITLIPPFWFDEERLPGLLAALTAWADKSTGFEIHLKDFNCFKPRVLFIDVIRSDDLIGFQKSIKQYLKDEWRINSDKRENFHPHLTIAFKDLRTRAFYAAWEYFSNVSFEAVFRCDEITLLKHVNGGWKGHDQIPLRKDG